MRDVSAFVDFGKLLYMIGFQGVLALPTLNVANITVFLRSLSFGLVGCCFSLDTDEQVRVEGGLLQVGTGVGIELRRVVHS